MNSLWRILAVVALLGAVVVVSQPSEAAAQVPYSVTYSYRAPVTYYYAGPPVVSVARPTIVYSPVIAAPVYAAPAPMAYVPTASTVVRYRGPLGILPRRTVVYSSGGFYAPAPAVVYPAW